MSTSIFQSNPIPEDFIEVLNTIHQFPTSADFAIWLTNNQFNHHVYENKIEEEKYKRTYHYDFDGHIFFQGKAELDLNHFPTKTSQALMNNSLPSVKNPLFDKVGKHCISRVFVEPYYTVISHGLYKTKIVGMVWEIYNLNHLLTLNKLRIKQN